MNNMPVKRQWQFLVIVDHTVTKQYILGMQKNALNAWLALKRLKNFSKNEWSAII